MTVSVDDDRLKGETGKVSGAGGSGDGGRSDASHLARSGLVQLLAAVTQSLMLVTQIVAARLFGPLMFGTYQTAVAIVDMLARTGMAGADKGISAT